MSEFPIEPLGDLIFVRRDEDYNGRIILRDPDDRQEKSLRGIVVAAGPGKPMPDGGALAMDVKVGDKIHFGQATGIESEFAGMHLLVMRNDDVLAVFE